MQRSKLAELTERRVAEEEAAALSADDVAGLERKLNAFRWLLWLFFPRGFGFELGEQRLRYNALRGRLEECSSSKRGDFVVVVPKLTMQEAIRNNHISELAISMFLRIRLLRRLDPRKVYALFALLQVDDYGHLKSRAALLRWLARGLRYTFALRLPVPPLPQVTERGMDAVSRDARPPPDARLFAGNRGPPRLADRSRFR
jgi:hypothetical protein